MEQRIVKGNYTISKSVLDFPTDPRFQEVNTQNQNDSNTLNGFCLPKLEIVDHNVLVERTVFNRSTSNMERTSKNPKNPHKITTGPEDE